MKKALAILLALSMVFAAFAGEPVVSNSVVEFKGDASLEWQYDLDAEAYGLINGANANLKINIVEGGDKATSGDGIWGELKIKVDGTSVNNGVVKTIEKDIKDGDDLAAMEEALGAAGEEFMNNGRVDGDKYKVDVKSPLYPSASVDVAKIHFVDGDNAVVLNLKSPDLKLADGFDVNNLDAGFAVETSAKDIGSLTFKFQDNGVAKDKKYAYGADVSVSAIENASLSAKWANNGDLTTLGADASYDIAIDTSKLTPSVSYKMLNNGKTDDIEKQDLTVKLAFTWDGAEEVEVDYAEKGTGAWVSYNTSLAEGDKGSIEVAAFDNTLVEGLKVGAKYNAKLDTIGKDDTAKFGAKYSTAIDIVDLEVSGGVALTIKDETTADYKYAATVQTDDIIDNTTVYAKYTDGGKDKKGKITVGAKIAL